MTWRDSLRVASFRGMEFHTNETQDPVGRRQVVHEYPLRDIPYVEDMGLFAGEIRMPGFIIGPEYHTARDKFVALLNKPGPGLLVHPKLGELTVSVLPGSQTHSISESGMVRFDLVFVQGAPIKNPTARTDTAAKVSKAADESAVANAADLDDGFSLSEASDWVAEAATELVNDVMDQVDAVLDTLAIDEVLGAVSAVKSVVSDVRNAAETLIRTPAALAGQFVGTIAGISALATTPLAAFGAYGRLVNRVDRLTNGGNPSTSSGLRSQKNRQALLQFAKTAAVFEMARQISGGLNFESNTDSLRSTPEAVVLVGGPDDLVIPLVDQAVHLSPMVFESRDQALAAQSDLLARIEQLMPTAGDHISAQLIDLRASVVADVKIRAANLPAITEYRPLVTRPSLAIAWDLYRDADMAAGIVARNALPHPGFVPGGEALEVLTDA